MDKNVIEGLSTLTTIEQNDLNRLVELTKLIIIDELVEQLELGNNTTSIDIGLGTLGIHYSGDSIKFKFTPNAKFEEDVSNACIHKINFLDCKVETALKDKIVNTYKDLL